MMINRKIENKITGRDHLTLLVADWRKQGKVVGFTSGAFDLLHLGHVKYLEHAKAACDVLIVGVNSDESVRGYKGEGRPVISEQARLWVVAALESVDYVFLFGERRNKQNIEMLKPSLYIKAGDYKEEELTSASVVREYGGEVLIVSMEEGYSTTKIIERIKKL